MAHVNSDYPGCVYCMKAGTPVKPGEICPICTDRLPTKEELEKIVKLVNDAHKRSNSRV